MEANCDSELVSSFQSKEEGHGKATSENAAKKTVWTCPGSQQESRLI